MYLRNLAEKGILRMGNLISDNNELITKSNYNLRELNIWPLDICRLACVVDAIPAKWRETLTTSAPLVNNEPFNLHNEIKPVLIETELF